MVEELNDAPLVLLGPLADGSGVADVGEVPELDRLARRFRIDLVQVPLLRYAFAAFAVGVALVVLGLAIPFLHRGEGAASEAPAARAKTPV